jgi:hypothetical protein
MPAARSHGFVLLRRASGWVAAVLVGLAGAVVTTVAAPIIDGVPNGDYGLGARLASFVLLTLMSTGLPTLRCFSTRSDAERTGRSFARWPSFMPGHHGRRDDRGGLARGDLAPTNALFAIPSRLTPGSGCLRRRFDASALPTQPDRN